MDEKIISETIELLEQKKIPELKSAVNKMMPADLALLFEKLDKADAVIVFRLLNKDLAAVTFALFSQILEFIVAKRETDRAIGKYIGAGSVEVESPLPASTNTFTPRYTYSDPRVPLEIWGENTKIFREEFPYKRLTQEQIDEIASMSYVTDVDTRYMTAGVSDEYYRMPEDGGQYDYPRTCVVVGTVVDIQDRMETHYTTGQTVPKFKTLFLKDVEILAGNPSCNDDTEFRVNSKDIFIDPIDMHDEHYFNEEHTEAFLVQTTYDLFPTREEMYSPEAIGRLNIGDRYVFITRFNAHEETDDGVFDLYFTDPFLDTMPGIYNITDEPVDFLEMEKYGELIEYIDMVNTDVRTFDVVYTKDMESIRFFADDTMQIVEGRSIRSYDAGKEICVISVEMATEFGLGVGDTLTLKLGNKLFEQYLNRGAVAVVLSVYRRITPK